MPSVNTVFVEPNFPPTQRNFVRALAEVGATVIGIGETPTDGLDEQLKSWMSHYHHVPSVVDVGVMTDAVRWIQGRAWVDRLEATIESHTLTAAKVRENCTIPGTSVRTAWLCRDKPSMKEVLRADLSAPGHEVVQSYIVIPTGAASGGKHTHPGEEIAFVIEGSLRVEIDGEPPVVKNAGESIIVPAGRIHFASNAGSGTVRAVATWVVEKGKPRTAFVQQ